MLAPRGLEEVFQHSPLEGMMAREANTFSHRGDFYSLSALSQASVWLTQGHQSNERPHSPKPANTA